MNGEVSRVALVRCPDYRPETVEKALRRLLLLCPPATPGPGALLFKPNMLSARPPGDNVTTHPAVVEAACRAFPHPGSMIADSPARSRKPLEEYWQTCGYRQVSDKTGVPLARFSRSRLLNLEAAGRATEVPVAEQFFETRLFNLPKLKTHGLTLLTGPVKNLYGLVPGYVKSLLHGRFLSSGDFCSLLAALYLAVRERIFYTVVDAVTIMEGNGPANGSPRETGFLVGGSDALACEIACAAQLGLEPAGTPVLGALREAGCAWPGIELVGDEIPVLHDFRLPAGQDMVNFLSSRWLGPLGKFIGNRFRLVPEIDAGLCRRCGLCRDVCPREAVTPDHQIDRALCIYCLCCFEVCPHRAVKLRKSLVARFVR